MRRAFAAVAAALCLGNIAQAHDFNVDRGYRYIGETEIPWEVATARANIAGPDVGRPGAMFVAATTPGGAMMALTANGWQDFQGGVMEPVATFEKLPARHAVFAFNSRDLDRRGNPIYNVGLSGNTLCEAAAALGATRFVVAIGYGVLSDQGEETARKSQELNTGLDADHVRLAFVNDDMMSNKKWKKVYDLACNIDTGG